MFIKFTDFSIFNPTDQLSKRTGWRLSRAAAKRFVFILSVSTRKQPRKTVMPALRIWTIRANGRVTALLPNTRQTQLTQLTKRSSAALWCGVPRNTGFFSRASQPYPASTERPRLLEPCSQVGSVATGRFPGKNLRLYVGVGVGIGLAVGLGLEVNMHYSGLHTLPGPCHKRRM